MKKFLALAALVLGLASCQTEPEGLDINVGGNQLVNVAVGLPEATRTSSGTGFDLTTLEANDLELRYILEIYVEGNTEDCIRKEAFSTNSQVVFPVRLIPGRNYRVVAWADIVPENANRTEGDDYDYYYETSNGLTAVTIVENTEIKWNAMDENRDAFTAFQTINNFTANTTIDLTLYRPFAKIRVVSTDIKDIEDLGFELGTGEVVYGYDMNRKFNAYFGTSSDASYKTHALAYPTPYAASNDAYETATQRTLYADYIFVDNIENPDVVQFSLTVNDKSGNLIKTTAFNTDIPVHANKLTTLIGEVLTEGGHVKITVDNDLQEAERVTVVSSASHLLQVVNAGGEYILGNNIVVTEDDKNEIISLATRANEPKTTTINLNGYTITLEADIEVEAGNTLNIKNQPVDNNGNEQGAIDADGGAIVNNGTLNIEGGVFNEASVENNGTLNIEGGVFNETSVENNGTVNISGGEFADDAIVNNGTANIEGENADRAEDIVVNGAEAVVSNIVYTVEELQAALDKGVVDQIIFGDNLVGDATIVQKEGVNVFIDGADKKFDGTLYIHGSARNAGAETVKIANVNFESETAKWFIDSNSTSEKERYAHNVTIENCTFTSLAADNSVAVCGPRFRQAYNITIKGCTATNTFFLAWFTGGSNHTIEDCKAINNYEGITFGPCDNSVIKGSKIDAVLYGVRYEATTEKAHNVTIEDCELSGFIPVSVRNIVAGNKPINVKFVGNNTLTEGGLYDVVFAANEYKSGVVPALPTGEWTIEGADNYVVFPREYKVSNVDQLKEAITYAKTGLNKSIIFAADIVADADVYIAQEEGVNLIINGNNHKFNRGFIVDGQNRAAGTDTVLFTNINFYTEESAPLTFISCPSKYNGKDERYSHNVTIDGCTFAATTLSEEVGAISAQKTYHLTVKNCTATNLHSLLQVQSCDNDVTVENVKVENCKSGISMGNTKDTKITKAQIVAQKYGIRFEGTTSREVKATITESSIKAYAPVTARKVTTGCDIKIDLTGTTLEAVDGLLDVVIANNKDYEDGVAPITPTGTWEVVGADDYRVFPRYDISFVSTFAELIEVLNADKSNIVLAADITYDKNYSFNKNATINLNGKSIELPLLYVFSNSTIKNGTINGKVYARSNCDVKFENLTFSGAVSDNLSTEGHLAIQGGCKVYAKSCIFDPTSVTGTQTRPLSFEGGNSTLKFEDCEFKNEYKRQVYLNSLSSTGSVDFTNCNFNNKTPNIMLAATCPFTNVTMTGTTKLSSVTFEINRAKDAVTENDLDYLRTLINNNSFSTVRVFYAGGSSEYIK